MNNLEALRLLNQALGYGLAGLAVAQEIARVLETAETEDRPIGEDEWTGALREADFADARLSAAINRARARQG